MEHLWDIPYTILRYHCRRGAKSIVRVRSSACLQWSNICQTWQRDSHTWLPCHSEPHILSEQNRYDYTIQVADGSFARVSYSVAATVKQGQQSLLRFWVFTFPCSCFSTKQCSQGKNYSQKGQIWEASWLSTLEIWVIKLSEVWEVFIQVFFNLFSVFKKI